MTLSSAFHAFSNVEDANDVRLDAEMNLAFQSHRRISLLTGVTINYDHGPAAGADEFELATHTMLAFLIG